MAPPCSGLFLRSTPRGIGGPGDALAAMLPRLPPRASHRAAASPRGIATTPAVAAGATPTRQQRNQPREFYAQRPQRPPAPNLNYTHILHVVANRKNTLATLTDRDGQPLTMASCGMAGFKGANRASVDAALAAGKLLADKAKNKGINVPKGMMAGGVWVKLNGFGTGRDGIVRAVREAEWRIVRLQDTTPLPWGGDRPVKRKRR
ncbi:hypothetical protein DFJ74DRAFT_687280 [Hyaloraphidium curvatum]|nr:hypothetical protein DFJ74DRAFT_687280 [Hyaloraphidium curvatum]